MVASCFHDLSRSIPLEKRCDSVASNLNFDLWEAVSWQIRFLLFFPSESALPRCICGRHRLGIWFIHMILWLTWNLSKYLSSFFVFGISAKLNSYDLFVAIFWIVSKNQYHHVLGCYFSIYGWPFHAQNRKKSWITEKSRFEVKRKNLKSGSRF